MSSFPQQPDDDLRIDTAWREQYSGASMNQKFQGIIPKGVYQGFKVKVKSGLQVEVHGAGVDNIAIVEVGSYSLTARMPSNKKKALTLVAGKKQYIVLEAQYAKNMASTVGCFVRDTVPANAIMIAEVTLAAGATSIPSDALKEAPAAKPVKESDFAALFAMQLETATRLFNVEQKLDKIASLTGLSAAELDFPEFNG